MNYIYFLFHLFIILIILFIVYFMANEIIRIINQNLKEYLTDFWSSIEWSIIITTWVSLIMFGLRLNEANNVLRFFKATQGYAYINLQLVNQYNQLLTFSLGLCIFFSSIKFLKLLSFNKYISFLGLTLKNCFGELASFSFFFFHS